MGASGVPAPVVWSNGLRLDEHGHRLEIGKSLRMLSATVSDARVLRGQLEQSGRGEVAVDAHLAAALDVQAKG